MERVRRGVMGWRVAVLAALALLSCATVPQSQVIQLSDGPRITVRQGCPVTIGENDLKRVDSDAFAINEESVPYPAFFHGRLDPADLASYIIVMQAGSYNPSDRFQCTSGSLHSFILIEDVANTKISISPVQNWKAIAGPDAIKGYDNNVRKCRIFGSSWPAVYRKSTEFRQRESGRVVVSPSRSDWNCEYHTDERSLALLLKVGRSSFVVSKIVDDLYVTEIE
jgi:hypothetical protein